MDTHEIAMEAEFKEIVPGIRKLAAEKGVQDLKFETVCVSVYRGGAFSEEPAEIGVSGNFQMTKAKEKDEFSAAAQKMMEDKSIPASLELEPQFKGMPFPTIKKVTSVLKKADGEQDLAPKAGEVTLFDFWATWCGPCQGPMAHNQEMLTKHPEWAGKARIVGVSIDDSIEAPEKRVKEKGWTNIDHYWVSGGWGADICKALGINGIPFCVLVDGNGVIQLTGHPSSMALDTNIPLLIAGKSLAAEDKPEGDHSDSIKDKTFTYEKCKETMAAFTTANAPDISKLSSFMLAGVYKKQFKELSFELVENFLVVRFEWSKKNKDTVAKVKASLNTFFAAKITLRQQDREIVQGEVKRGTKCDKCSASLVGEDQYCCTICKPEKYFCLKCIDNVPSPTKSSELSHEHGLYLIQKASAASLEELRFFNFVMTEKEATERTHGGVRCDCCRASPVGIRWKCAVCADVDICESCFKIAKTPTDPKYDETVAKAKGVNHDLHEHVYIKMDFGGWINLYPGH